MAIYPHKLKRALHQCRRGQGLWSWSYNATCNPARTQERYQGSSALDSRERVVTRLCVLGMPLTRSPAQSACRMVLRLPLLWTSAYTEVRVLLRALPAGFHPTTIGRLGPSPVERVDRVICLNNHHRATWSQPRCAESIPGFSREGQCPVVIDPYKLKHTLHRCGRGQGLWSWVTVRRVTWQERRVKYSVMLRALRRCRRGRGPWYLGYRGKYGPAQRQEGYHSTLGGLYVGATSALREVTSVR